MLGKNGILWIVLIFIILAITISTIIYLKSGDIVCLFFAIIFSVNLYRQFVVNNVNLHRAQYEDEIRKNKEKEEQIYQEKIDKCNKDINILIIKHEIAKQFEQMRNASLKSQPDEQLTTNKIDDKQLTTNN